MKENFIKDIVDQVNSPNDEYDGFLPVVNAEHDTTAEVELNVWKGTTYNKHSYMQSQNGYVEEYYDDLLCHR